jgi:hypothetical protein
MKKLFWFMILFLILPSMLGAQSGSAGQTGFAFLKIGVGGRGAALANSFTADAMGAVATFWNPANLASSPNEVFFSHTEWLQDVKNDYVAVKFNGLGAAWGLSLHLQNVGGIQQRTKASAEPIGEIAMHDVAFGLSYARKLSQNFDFGVTAKYLGERILSFAANGFAFDFGSSYRFSRINGLRLAVSIHNIGSVEKLREEKIALPTYLRAGLVYQPDFQPGTHQIKFFAGYVNVFDSESGLSGGIEFVANGVAALRAGYQFGSDNQSFSGGVGLVRDGYRFDYAYAPFDLDLGDTHRFSLAIGL